MPDIVNKREHAVRVATEGGGPAARLRAFSVPRQRTARLIFNNPGLEEVAFLL